MRSSLWLEGWWQISDGCLLTLREVGLQKCLMAPFSPQEDCEFYLTAQQFIVLPMERQRMEASNGYSPWGGWGLCF